MQMPEMDGLTLAHLIQEQQGPKPHLIMMTSVGQVGDARRFKKAGFAAYLVKPVGQQDILDTLATVVSGKPPSTELYPIVTRHTVREMRRKNIQILLAEDNLVNQHVAIKFLKKIGHTGVDTVKNGKEALKALATTPYDLCSWTFKCRKWMELKPHAASGIFSPDVSTTPFPSSP